MVERQAKSPLMARDNLAVWSRLGGFTAPIDPLLERVGLPTDRTEPIRAFSAGMRRRLALALALLKKPDLFLFDEPFAALDPTGRELVAGLLQSLREEGTPFVIATHLPAMAAPLCDAAIHLDGGQISWQGSPLAAPSVSPLEAELAQ
jgi:ABC-2 type transport system ATP-binding protein